MRHSFLLFAIVSNGQQKTYASEVVLIVEVVCRDVFVFACLFKKWKLRVGRITEKRLPPFNN